MRLIDADAFAEFIKKTIREQDYHLSELCDRLTIADVLDAVVDELEGNSLCGYENNPTIEECKTGRWIRHSIGHQNTPWEFDCSICDTWFVISEDTAERYNYCPNCGAKMLGVDKEYENI